MSDNNMKYQQKTISNYPEWLIILFIIASIFTIRKVVWMKPIDSQFNEYTTIFVYASDIVLVVIIIIALISILCNLISFLSIFYPPRLFSKLFVPRGTISKPASILNVPRGTFKYIIYIVTPLFLLIWSFLSVNWSLNPEIAFYRSIRLLLGISLYFYILHTIVPRGTIINNPDNKIVPRGTILTTICSILIFLGLMQSLIAIGQFSTGKSLGLHLIGESRLGIQMAGVAKVFISDKVFVRGYGLFPHPNILSAFLVISLILALSRFKALISAYGRNGALLKNSSKSLPIHWPNVDEIVPRGTLNNDPDNKIVPRGTFLKTPITGAIFLLSWTKNLLLIPARFFYRLKRPSCLENSNCSTWNNLNIEFKKTLKRYLLPYNRTKIRLMVLVIAIHFIGILISFSKSGFLAIFLALFFLLLLTRRGIVPRGTLSIDQDKKNVPRGTSRLVNFSALFGTDLNKPISNKPFQKNSFLIGLVLLIAITSFLLYNIDYSRYLVQSYEERVDNLLISVESLPSRPFIGAGIGQSVIHLSQSEGAGIETWRLQPIHNAFLLVWAELGLIGFILFLSFYFGALIYTFKRAFFSLEGGSAGRGSGETPHLKYYYLAFLSLLPFLLFDHFLWDIYPGQILFWVASAILIGSTMKREAPLFSIKGR